MKVRINKRTALIIFENEKELEGIRIALEYYMDMIHEPNEDGRFCLADDTMEKLDEKFNK